MQKRINNQNLIRVFKIILLGIIISGLAFFGFNMKGFSPGYLYLIVVFLSGYWFGLRGGLLAAFMAIGLSFTELNLLYKQPWPMDIYQDFIFRVLAYITGSLCTGLLAGKIIKLKKRLQVVEHYDELTGCLNYRWIMHTLSQEIKRAQRYNNKLSIIMLDLDYFKKINDNYGHLFGNEVLKFFSATVKGCIRDIDVVGRFGGDEFLIILPFADAGQAINVIKRIKQNLKKVDFCESGIKVKKELLLKFSAGVVCFPENGITVNELLRAADHCLLQSKVSGKNKITAEKRHWLRINPFPGFIMEVVNPKTGTYFYPARIYNISAQGAFLLSQEKLYSQKLYCIIRLPNQNQSAKIICKVIHRKVASDYEEFGIYFESLPNTFARTYQDLLYDHFKGFNNITVH